MGVFWSTVTTHEIDAIYDTCRPTPNKVIDAIMVEPKSKKEEKVTRWLRLYLRESNEKELKRFLWFCTGTDLLVPDRRIKVQFNVMSSLAQRPKAQTCFCILTLPSTYLTFQDLKANLDLFLSNPESWGMSD